MVRAHLPTAARAGPGRRVPCVPGRPAGAAHGQLRLRHERAGAAPRSRRSRRAALVRRPLVRVPQRGHAPRLLARLRPDLPGRRPPLRAVGPGVRHHYRRRGGPGLCPLRGISRLPQGRERPRDVFRDRRRAYDWRLGRTIVEAGCPGRPRDRQPWAGGRRNDRDERRGVRLGRPGVGGADARHLAAVASAPGGPQVVPGAQGPDEQQDGGRPGAPRLPLGAGRHLQRRLGNQ
mmetsp:Transcript_57502/g.180115  ORF Transcript_57502/g.180115 Transcript_57502/m.180115 type:complete len:233 (+) Transcript_57502:225-923(+)